jgi:hypothetical protein
MPTLPLDPFCGIVFVIVVLGVNALLLPIAWFEIMNAKYQSYGVMKKFSIAYRALETTIEQGDILMLDVQYRTKLILQSRTPFSILTDSVVGNIEAKAHRVDELLTGYEILLPGSINYSKLVVLTGNAVQINADGWPFSYRKGNINNVIFHLHPPTDITKMGALFTQLKKHE